MSINIGTTGGGGGGHASSDDAVSLSSVAGAISGSGSFWDPANYKRTTKRIDDAHKLCNDFCSLIQERADIEKTYAKSLHSWSKKWSDFISKGPEYGTTEVAWKSMFAEADQRHEHHMHVREALQEEVITAVKLWQKDNFHKSMMHFKERKELDEQFKKVQKPWAKLHAKVNKSKAEYHSACKALKTAENLERNASGDANQLPDQIKKLHDRVLKCKDDVSKTRERYENSLRDLSDSTPRYMEDMKLVFTKCQINEEKRLEFFKKILSSTQKCLDISQDETLARIYKTMAATIEQADAAADLQWWSNNHGTDMPMSWPRFIEYSEEFRDIVDKKTLSKSIGLHGGANPVAKSDIILVNQKYNGGDDVVLPPAAAAHQRGTHHHIITNANHANSSITTSTTTSSTTGSSNQYNSSAPRPSSLVGNESRTTTAAAAAAAAAANITHSQTVHNINGNHKNNGGSSTVNSAADPRARAQSTASNATTTFYDESDDWDDDVGSPASGPHKGNSALDGAGGSGGPSGLVDDGRPGVRVRALYDYTGAEADELSFKQGDFFEKLEDEDDQGWCVGRKDGRLGLYPANYVEVSP